MFLINLLSKIPFIDTSSIEGIVQHNRLILIIGLTIYGILGAIIYFKHLPEPYNKYLNHYTIMIMALIDVALYNVFHKMSFGVFPPLTIPHGLPMLPPECVDGVCKPRPKMDVRSDAAVPKPMSGGGGGNGFKPPAPPISEDLGKLAKPIAVPELEPIVETPNSQFSSVDDDKLVQETSKYDNRFFDEEDVLVENWESNDQTNSELNLEFGPDDDDDDSAHDDD